MVASTSLPLPSLLSQALVAFTIEFDNEAEHRLPHRTTNHGSTAGSLHAPWLVSMVMWSNCMRFVGEAGVRIGELEELARTTTNLNGMVRWGYIVVSPDPAASRPKPPRSRWIIRATPAGKKAREIWRPLFSVIEERWEMRFGEDAMTRLRESLGILVSQLEAGLPDCLPILGYGLFSRGPDHQRPALSEQLALPALLSRALLAFAIEFERESELSLAVCANVVRVLDEEGVRVRDLPRVSGVSKEAISMAMSILQKKHITVVSGNPKIARLTPQGHEAQSAYRQLLGAIENRWRTRFGKDTVGSLRESIEGLSLFAGSEPYPNGWRASVRKPVTLPHYPMVLHRGGFPDGS